MGKLSVTVANFPHLRKDPHLRRVLQILHWGLVGCGCMEEVNLEIEEIETKEKGVYYKVNNQKLNLCGFLGRDIGNGEIIYLCLDRARFKWAESEGFNEVMSYQDICGKVGVMRRFVSLDDLLKFIAGFPNYKLTGEYLLDKVETKEEFNSDFP